VKQAEIFAFCRKSAGFYICIIAAVVESDRCTQMAWTAHGAPSKIFYGAFSVCLLGNQLA
jgi:hypothetical protein